MKKLSLILCAVTCLLTVTATSCSKETDNSAAISESSQTSTVEHDATPVKHNVVKVTQHAVDMPKCAYTLKELIEYSDFIAKVKVIDTSSYVPEGGLEVDTMVTPEISEVYKGEYNGNPLYISGGFIKLKEYISGNKSNPDADILPDIMTKESLYSEEELEEEIYDNFINNYIPDPGDTLIYFGEESKTKPCYAAAYTYQGVFLCEDGIVENQALESRSKGYCEPLVEDMAEMFSGAQIVDQTREFCSNEECMKIPEDDFIAKLKELCSQ